MLTPETRILLTDGLRPPAGTHLDLAVATSYSLDLHAMLIAPLTFALFDLDRSDPAQADPIRLLEATRRYGERITIYCQAGGIAVPPSQVSPVLAFVEDSVVQVHPEDGVFHPKVWALRFAHRDGTYVHRLLVLSRNLTFDRSWDTMLLLDEEPGAETAIPTGPLIDWLQAIPQIAITDSRSDQVDELCSTLQSARFVPPQPFTETEFLPRGFGEGGYAFPPASHQALAISPFLSSQTVAALRQSTRNLVLVSRPETFERLGADALGGVDSRVLDRSAETLDLDEEGQPETPEMTFSPNDGLHAKTVIFDLGHKAEIITGSANLTHSGWHRNVEFGVRLRGPKRRCGVDSALEAPGKETGLANLLTAYTPQSSAGETDPAEATLLEIEQAHAEFAAARPVLTIAGLTDEAVSVELHAQAEWTGPGQTTVRLVTVPGQQRRLDGRHPVASWSSIAQSSVTPYLVVETTAGTGAAKATRHCVIKADLTGDIAERASSVLAQLISRKEDVLRYLILLLGDPAYDAWAAELGAVGGGAFTWGAGRQTHDYALFEPLIRAAGRDEMALARVASLVDELGAMPNGADLVPEGFDDLWAAVWEVHQETQS